ncbi:MAG TPA: hypothetical protein VMM76_21740 [Pirellulaceae bacterium]|nr:hypothetical protein [Pirellulaceae bacterium]
MNVGKLKRVAIQEFKRSPAKSGILLAMLPVAFYFCVPLLFGAIKKSSPATNAAPVLDSSKKAAFVMPAVMEKTATSGRVQQGWVEVERWLENDLLATPAGLPISTRNPFAAIGHVKKDEALAVIEADERVVGSESEEDLENSVDPATVTSNPIRELGLQLNATMVGKRSRLATINGKTYKEGETIPVNIEADMGRDQATMIQIQLTHVDRRFVVLQLDSHQHRLQLRNELPNDAIVVKSRIE